MAYRAGAPQGQDVEKTGLGTETTDNHQRTRDEDSQKALTSGESTRPASPP